MSAFVCCQCGQRVDDPNARFQKRVEFRRADAKTRPHVRNVGDYCKRCMEREVNEAKGAVGTQGTLA